MRILSFDWATKKALTVYDPQKNKIKSIPNTIEDFERFLEEIGGGATKQVSEIRNSLPSSIFLFEFGGADTFKIMAYRAGYVVLQVPGKKIRDYRESLGKEKNDKTDAKLIYEFWKENDGDGANTALNKKSKPKMPIPIENKGGGANSVMRNSTPISPSPFYFYQESDADIAEIKILFRQHEDIKQSMVREKNKCFAFERQFKIANVANDMAKKVKFHKDASIIAKEKELDQIKKILKKKIQKFPIWQNYLKDVKAVGEVIASGLIGELGGKQFESDESLKHYAGMVAKNEHHDYNRNLKAILYQFAEGVVKHKTPKWRELYDNMKVYYQKKHEDWSKGKVNNYAKKFIETKFLLEFWKEWKREC